MAVSKMLHQKFGTKKGSKWREMELGSAWHLQTLVLILRAQHDPSWEVQHSSSPALEFRDFLYIPVYCLVMFGVYFPPWCKLLHTAAPFVTCLQLVQRELRLHTFARAVSAKDAPRLAGSLRTPETDIARGCERIRKNFTRMIL